ncbi:MAG TPA: carbohydrate deacetylase [Selenomonadales bacterium]|nr:carbohydrate deacetylase [Selenomonadales bacterium]
MLRLIVNADDLGLTPGCNVGILRAMTEGIVSDTSILINAEFAEPGIALLKARGIHAAGLHLTLTSGKPVVPAGEVPSLVGPDGRFRRRAAEMLPVAKRDEAERELRAQVARFLDSGLTLNHLDSHHHIHGYPELLDLVVALARELGVPLRQTAPAVKARIAAAGVAAPDHFSLRFYGPDVSGDLLKEIIGNCREGVLEIMCHPAAPDAILPEVSSYCACRRKELDILTDPAVKAFIRERDIQLVSFAELV